nr:hypothetical protein [Pseudomonas gingeri]
MYFFWEASVDGFSPSCNSSFVNEGDVGPLACLLTDDGGQRSLDTVPWLGVGAGRIKAVKGGEIDFVGWSRDAWGAELTRNQVKVYSLYDESYFEVMDINSFEVALLAWIDFIQMKPELEGGCEVEI